MHFIVLMPFDGYSHKSAVVLDNASIHHVDRVIETIKSVGAIVRFLPSYSPDMNPIEVFAEVKQHLLNNNTLFQATTSLHSITLSSFLSVSK